MERTDAWLGTPLGSPSNDRAEPHKRAPRILVVDDHPIIRIGLVRMIEQAFATSFVEQAGSLAEARRMVAHGKPDIITLDLQLPDAHGTEALLQLLRAAPGVPILVISQGSEVTHAQRSIELGASGYLSKDRAAGELVLAMKRLLNGGRYVPIDVADRLLGMLEGKQRSAFPHERLTSQEYRVFQLIAAGQRPSHIADTMHLSVKTVANYRARVLEKGGWRNNIELTKYCMQHGLTSDD